LSLVPTQPPIQGVTAVKRPGREADRSTSSSKGFKNALNYNSTHPYVFMAWLFKQKDNFMVAFTPRVIYTICVRSQNITDHW
jgi:hypothetical protein